MADFIKTYVAITARVDTEGRAIPLSIEWETGERFKIDKILEVRMAPPQHVGGVLTRRYRIRIGRHVRDLYHETQTNRYFVEKPVY